MADVAAAIPVTAASKAKTARKTGGGEIKKAADHPKYAQMIKEALAALKERGGSSRVAILRYITKQYHLAGEEKIINSHLKLALRAGVKNGALKQSKGMGASGSFRLGEMISMKKPHPKKAATKTKKLAGAKKPAGAKKVVRKPTATGTPMKATSKPKAAKPKTPKKAKVPKPAKAKAPKKVKSPKKAAKPTAAGKAKKVVKK